MAGGWLARFDFKATRRVRWRRVLSEREGGERRYVDAHRHSCGAGWWSVWVRGGLEGWGYGARRSPSLNEGGLR